MTSGGRELAVTVRDSNQRQGSVLTNQLNYVPSRGINNLAYHLANKAFARFAYSALVAWIAYDGSRSRMNCP